MVFFIDESGHPHPNDPVPCPVLAAVGVPAARSRMLMGTLFRLKRDILGITETSHSDDRFKAKAVLNEHTHRRVPAKWQFVEELVNAAVNLPVVSFFIVMERPAAPPDLRLAAPAVLRAVPAGAGQPVHAGLSPGQHLADRL